MPEGASLDQLPREGNDRQEPGLDQAQDASDRQNEEPSPGDEDEGLNYESNCPDWTGCWVTTLETPAMRKPKESPRDPPRLPTSGEELVARVTPETTS